MQWLASQPRHQHSAYQTRHQPLDQRSQISFGPAYAALPTSEEPELDTSFPNGMPLGMPIGKGRGKPAIPEDLQKLWQQKRQENLVECGYIDDLRLNDDGELEEKVLTSHNVPKWRRTVASTKIKEEEMMKDRLLVRAKADKLFVLVSALISGTAVNMLLQDETKSAAHLKMTGRVYCAYMSFLASAIALNLTYVVVSASVVFNVSRIMSQTSATSDEIADKLKSFWSDTASIRSAAYDAFLIALLSFSLALALRSWSVLDSPANWVMGLTLAICGVGGTLVGSWLARMTGVIFCQPCEDAARFCCCWCVLPRWNTPSVTPMSTNSSSARSLDTHTRQ